MMQNFTAQREALTKIQEMVEEFGNKQNDESIGKTGKRYFAYFASPEYREAFPDVDPIEDFIAGDLSELTRFAEQFNVFKTRYNRDLRLSADGANNRCISCENLAHSKPRSPSKLTVQVLNLS